MTKARCERNMKIKKQVVALIKKDYPLKQALHIVGQWYYLSAKAVEKIYYETRVEA